MRTPIGFSDPKGWHIDGPFSIHLTYIALDTHPYISNDKPKRARPTVQSHLSMQIFSITSSRIHTRAALFTGPRRVRLRIRASFIAVMGCLHHAVYVAAMQPDCATALHPVVVADSARRLCALDIDARPARPSLLSHRLRLGLLIALDAAQPVTAEASYRFARNPPRSFPAPTKGFKQAAMQQAYPNRQKAAVAEDFRPDLLVGADVH